MKRSLVLLPFLLAACVGVPAQPVPLAGEWGGTHVALHLTATGGTLDYDCANGTIGPVLVAANGNFSTEGTHTAGHGGPVRQGEVLPSASVSFSGVVRGDRMTLQGRIANGTLIGPFELRRGAEPRLYRCL